MLKSILALTVLALLAAGCLDVDIQEAADDGARQRVVVDVPADAVSVDVVVTAQRTSGGEAVIAILVSGEDGTRIVREDVTVDDRLTRTLRVDARGHDRIVIDVSSTRGDARVDVEVRTVESAAGAAVVIIAQTVDVRERAQTRVDPEPFTETTTPAPRETTPTVTPTASPTPPTMTTAPTPTTTTAPTPPPTATTVPPTVTTVPTGGNVSV